MKTEFKTLKEMFPDPVLWKGYKAYFKKINTMPPVTLEEKILDALKHCTKTKSIEVLEKLGKRLRRENSVRINRGYSVGKFDVDRPDLVDLKVCE